MRLVNCRIYNVDTTYLRYVVVCCNYIHRFVKGVSYIHSVLNFQLSSINRVPIYICIGMYLCRYLYLPRRIYSAPRGEGGVQFKICGQAFKKNYGNATAAPPKPGRNFGPAFGGAHYSKQNKSMLQKSKILELIYLELCPIFLDDTQFFKIRRKFYRIF